MSLELIIILFSLYKKKNNVLLFDCNVNLTNLEIISLVLCIYLKKKRTSNDSRK